MKKYILTEEDKEEILNLIRSRSYLGARNYLSQLKEITQKEGNKK